MRPSGSKRRSLDGEELGVAASAALDLPKVRENEGDQRRGASVSTLRLQGGDVIYHGQWPAGLGRRCEVEPPRRQETLSGKKQ